jgi:histidinol dehydrogenase
LRVAPAELAAAARALSAKDRAALRRAFANIRRFHAAQQGASLRVETMPGVVCERVVRPIRSVGLYVPGGTAPLPSTALMLGVPSLLAACPVRVLCTPPGRDGSVSPWILAAAQLCGIDAVFKIGGAQAIAAMALGTETVPRCDKLFGPGNAYVHAAKAQLARDGAAAIDLPAGPSEVMVVADDGADAEFAAADLLAQAEHGPDSQAILVAFSQRFAERVRTALVAQLRALPRAKVAARSLAHSRFIVARDRAAAVDVANRYAPEHLLLQVARPRSWLPQIQAAGSIFVGAWTPESLGDYASGTNHVLPTHGAARFASGLGLADFHRSMTVQTASRAGLQRLGPVVEHLALAEGLAGHANAVAVRRAGRRQ